MVTVSCDRNDCWSDEELFKKRQAINLKVTNEIIENPVKRPRESRKLGQQRTSADETCWYKAQINLDVVIYVQSCDCDGDDCDCLTGRDKAYSLHGLVTRILMLNKNVIGVRRIVPDGSNADGESEGELDIDVVIGSFEIHYLFDPTRPWVIG